MKGVIPRPGLVLREDTTFAPGIHDFPDGEGIVIAADDIVVDGTGAVLRAAVRAPALPGEDFLYSPGDLGLHRERHELLLRRIDITEPGAGGDDGGAGAGLPLQFEYRYWGEARDTAAVAVSADRRDWRQLAAPGAPRGGEGWITRRWDIGPWEPGPLSLRLSVDPSGVEARAAAATRSGAAASSPALPPCFYDAFRLLRGDTVLWQGDARDHWQGWYNTGFSILKRSGKKFFSGTAFRAEGRRGVRLRGCTARGFLTALSLKECAGWTIEENDFSDNYDDPDYGWGEGTESFGGMYLEDVQHCVVRRNTGSRVWNGIVLRRSNDNTIEGNQFSHCSNTCLKMSQSSRNRIADNVLSWGLRIYPGEVHARDSVSLLVESGSDGNTFFRNDFTHGGDGIFIRVLNHWCSRGNLFEDNDCSYANNNAVESWSPGNTYVRNKASWSSYGFWLGGSDDTVLRDNEVMHNGARFRNAPEPFGNAGVSVVHGSSSGFLMTGNRIAENAGPGVALAYREDRPARLWLIAGNDIRDNRADARGYEGTGLFLEHCEDVLIAGNTLQGNEGRELVLGRGCRHVAWDARPHRVLEGLSVACAGTPAAGQEARFSVDAGGGQPLPSDGTAYEWDFGDGSRERTATPGVSHVFTRPGRARVSVIVRGAGAAGIASRLLCVLPVGRIIADCGRPEAWRIRSAGASSMDADSGCLASAGRSLKVIVRSGAMSSLSCALPAPLDLSGFSGVSFFYRYACELFTHEGKRNRTVGLRLRSGTEGSFSIVPSEPFRAEASEDRYDWVYFSAASESLAREGRPDMSAVTDMEIVFGPEEPADCILWVDQVMAW